MAQATSVADIPTGPKDAKSTVLMPDEDAIIVALRRYRLLPLDECLYAPQPTSGLPRASDRTSAHQDQAPLDKWPGRTDEPHDQESGGQTLPLRRPRPAVKSPRQRHQRPQLWAKVEAPQRPYPYEFICKQWTIEPERFALNPIQQMPGLNT
jgi:hypothetical protein